MKFNLLLTIGRILFGYHYHIVPNTKSNKYEFIFSMYSNVTSN